ncbi:ribosomal protein S18 acetylase RimI-like enzyme [Isoptericola sp. CG 20/1183]|uniref:Ribosomal protein S18 acetylase RimI-like enzyme n=1 Tax=Isoptericola halotolerans TaxID=300560 RepID=A0ABX5EGR8_9MICO|nr:MULTISPECIES: GNAT family acetyltransferase [Isoptericola]MCK0117906.1 GNAT family acetyltransferase [Isoptericola sp. S6320L]PRZ06987.1 ribosomal protein S18 acetylase RimI-like enzyme [Isoptericola halotolerans]PRZ07341.1 ribosomal protein S18 acetylase RimI-like enzyme [Isoptericola sp. CG 20/1183]
MTPEPAPQVLAGTLLREITDGDVEQVVALWRECDLTRPWNDPHRDIADARRNPTSTVLVALDATSGVVGSVMAGYEGHRGWLYYVAVAPSLQRSGLGRRLVEAAEDWLRGAGTSKVMLMVRTANEHVHDFYGSLGYTAQDVAVLGRWMDESR